MYVTVSGYSNSNKVFKTTNGGTSWTNISGDLPNIVINEVMLKQGQTSEYLYLATELGVYYSINGGTNWSKLGQGMPNVNVKDIEIHYTADKLVAGTFGRGLWEINIQNNTLSNDDLYSENDIVDVFPNPATEFLNINVNGDYKYIMYNVVGGIVKKGNLSPENNTINVKEIAKNMYILRVFNDNSSQSFKIIVK
jgi:xyloglucan-specific exo-beta-1,4-glucanase